MNALRRRLASGAIALTVLQLAVLFAAPVSACCLPFRLKAEAPQIEKAEAPDCCPAGSHAPGECPLHRESKTGSRPTLGTEAVGEGGCRMMCDAPHGPQLVPVAIGIISAPQSIGITLTASVLAPGARLIATARPSLPDAPPPRLL